MHNLQLVLQEPQPLDHAPRHAAQDVLGDVAPCNLLEAACVHVLHAVVDAGFDEEGAVEVDDVGRGGAVEDVKFGDDRFELGVVELEADLLRFGKEGDEAGEEVACGWRGREWKGVEGDGGEERERRSAPLHLRSGPRENAPTHLERHRHLGRLVPDLLYRTIVALAQLLEQLKVVHLDLERRSAREVNSVRMHDCLAAKVQSPRRVPGR